VLSLDGVVQRTYAQSYYTSGPTDSFAPEASPMLNRDGSRLSVSSNPSTSSAAGSLGVPLREALQLPLRYAGELAHHGAAIAKALGIVGAVGPLQPLDANGKGGGGQNEGVWVMHLGPAGMASIGHQEVVLKLISGMRKIHNLPTEAETIVQVANTFPNIREDPLLSFPLKVFDVHTYGPQQPQFTLFVMPKARGQRLADFISLRLVRQGGVQDVCEMLTRLGQTLKQFHLRYQQPNGSPLNHADFTPSNVNYDEHTREFTFIDLGGLGTSVTKTDVDHFCESIRIIANYSGGPSFHQQGCAAIRAGYGVDTPMALTAGAMSVGSTPMSNMSTVAHRNYSHAPSAYPPTYVSAQPVSRFVQR
jgi:hypothetical protein